MLSSFKQALVLAPHTDDGELGAGGTIAKLRGLGVSVHYLAFSAAEDSVPSGFPRTVLREEVKEATSRLSIPSTDLTVLDFKVRALWQERQRVLDEMISLRKRISPDLILLPSLGDIHQDHAVVAAEGLRAFKKACVLAYELPWNNLHFQSTCFVELDEAHVDAKVSALSQYRSQAGRDYMAGDFVRSLARMRGVQIGASFAEVFEVLRWRLA